MKRCFSSKYELSSESIGTKAVFFTKTNEWNVNFLQNTRSVWKSIKSEAVFTKTEMNNE